MDPAKWKILEYSEGAPLPRVENFRKQFLKESWTLFAITVVIAVIRYVARYRRFGFRGAQIDDALVFVAIASLTVMTVGINEHLANKATVNYIPPFVSARFTPEQMHRAQSNGKWIFVMSHMQIITLFCAKGAMVAIYYRLTEKRVARRMIIAVGAYVAVAFLADELTLLLTCLPISRRWVPGLDQNCAFYDNWQITDAVLSVSSTFLILVTGLPTLLKARLPFRQKCIISTLFSLGIFDLGADITCKVLLATMRQNGFIYYSWYMRTCFVALLVCNLPYCWSLLLDVAPGVKSWSSESGSNHSAPKFWKDSKWPKVGLHSNKPHRKFFSSSTVDTEKDAALVGSPKTAQGKTTTAAPFQAHSSPLAGGRTNDKVSENGLDLDHITSPTVFNDIETAVSAKRALDTPSIISETTEPEKRKQ